MLRLDDLPDDILPLILHELDYKSLVRSRAVSRAWRDTIASSASLRYHIWLGIHAKSDTFPSSSSSNIFSTPADRLSALLAQEHAWSTLNFRRYDTFTCSPDDRLRIAGTDVCERTRGGGGGGGRKEELAFVADRLPSLLSAGGGEDGHEGERLKLGRLRVLQEDMFEDCFFDADNELLICESRNDSPTHARKQFHLRWLLDPSLSHPLASTPILDTGTLLPYKPGSRLTTVRTMMIGNLVLVEVFDGDPHFVRGLGMDGRIRTSVILLWNWIEGRLVFRLELSHEAGLFYTDLSLLSLTTFMVPVARRTPVPSTDIPTSNSMKAQLLIYDFSPSNLYPDADGIPKPRLVRTFFLPALDPSIASLDFTCCSSLTNRRVWRRSNEETRVLAAFGNRTARALEIPKPFRPTDEDRLCALILEATPVRRHDWQHEQLFPQSYVIITTAQNLLRSYDNDWVPWNEWGGERAAMLYGNPIELRWGNCWYPHGLRIVVARRIYARARHPLHTHHGHHHGHQTQFHAAPPPPPFALDGDETPDAPDPEDFDSDSDEEPVQEHPQFHAEQEHDFVLRVTPHWRLEMFDFNPDRVRRFESPHAPWPPEPTFETLPPPPGSDPSSPSPSPSSSSSSSSAASTSGETSPAPRLPYEMTIVREPFLMDPFLEPWKYAFKDWPIRASMPFIRTRLFETSWHGDWLEMDMDSERVLVVKTRLGPNGLAISNQTDVLTF